MHFPRSATSSGRCTGCPPRFWRTRGRNYNGPVNSRETDRRALPEFIFGALSTPEGRARRARATGLGFYHDAVLSPIDPRPGEPITITVRVGAGVALASASLSYTADGASTGTLADLDRSGAVTLPLQRTCLAWDTLRWGYLEEWTARIPGQPAGARVRYVITGVTTDGRRIASPYIDLQAPEIRNDPGAFDMAFLQRLTRDAGPKLYEFYVDEEAPADWLLDAVIYQVFVDRFAPDLGMAFATPGDLGAFHGGTLGGLLSRLDYLADLGVTCLWLTPIFPSPSHHGYDATDYEAVEPRLGSGADFRELVLAAHRRGMRILLDFVANHVSDRHPAFLAARQDPGSTTRDWFYFREAPDAYETFYNVPDMPVLNSDNPDVRHYLVAAASGWLRAGCDGFRLDHAHGVSHGFWSEFRAAARAINPECATIGEITDTPAMMRSFAGRMDGCLDFRLLELLRGFFAFDTLTASQFDRELRGHLAYFGNDMVLPSFLDNHDMNRFLWSVNGDKRRLRLAALCQFTLPGPPIIYYGTEVGLSQARGVGRLEEARQPMLWGNAQDRSLLAFYKRLVALRRDASRAWALSRRTLVIDDRRGLYGYACGEYAVVLNRGRSPISIPLLATDPSAAVKGTHTLHLPPVAGAVCRLNR
jgi:cyclomaltodextrinase